MLWQMRRLYFSPAISHRKRPLGCRPRKKARKVYCFFFLDYFSFSLIHSSSATVATLSSGTAFAFIEKAKKTKTRETFPMNKWGFRVLRAVVSVYMLSSMSPLSGASLLYVPMNVFPISIFRGASMPLRLRAMSIVVVPTSFSLGPTCQNFLFCVCVCFFFSWHREHRIEVRVKSKSRQFSVR